MTHTPAKPLPQRRTLNEWLTRNPVTLKELRGRMRGARAFIVLIVYLVLMSAFVTLLYALYVSSSSNYGYPGSYSVGPDRQYLGKFVFGAVVGIELLLVCFICPAFTVGAISGERERQTYDLLRTTLLRARSLVLGKLVSSMAYVLLLLVAALPLQSLAFLLGGISAEEVAIATLLLVSTAFLFSTAGIFFSTVMRRTLGATILTYAFVLLDTLGLPLVMVPVLVLGSGLNYGFFQGTPPIPVQALLLYGAGLLIATNPLAAAITTEVILLSNQTLFYFTQTLTDDTGQAMVMPLVSPWLPWALFGFLLGAIFILISIIIVKRSEN